MLKGVVGKKFMYASHVRGGDKPEAYIYAYKERGGSKNQRSASYVLKSRPHDNIKLFFPNVFLQYSLKLSKYLKNLVPMTTKAPTYLNKPAAKSCKFV